MWGNGVAIYNALDGFSYNNLGIWQRNAYFWEFNGFDSCLVHPGPGGNHFDIDFTIKFTYH